jgi:hypothetical protein
MKSHYLFAENEIVGTFVDPSEVHHTELPQNAIETLNKFDSISIGWWHNFEPDTLGTSDAQFHLEERLSATLGFTVRCSMFRNNGKEIGLSDNVNDGIMLIWKK